MSVRALALTLGALVSWSSALPDRLSPARVQDLAPRATSTSGPLVNFQVQQPPALPKNAKTCTVEFVHHLFANSYYVPAIYDYTPPTNCGPVGSWAGISLNYTATSNGTQYDRLSAVTLSDVEIWRTSTAEPTLNGIIWTALKDVTQYIPLFSVPGSLVVDLNNIIDTSIGINGAYDVTLSATFYESSKSVPAAKKADVIIPISKAGNETAAYFSVPPSFSVNVTLPRNAAAAYAEIYASGNGEEEFWYYSVANQFFSYLPDGAAYNNGPFREVRLLVDGMLAGVAFPYPVIFTGGILPSLWRPMAAYGAFDQPTYKIDLTPFLPILSDGLPHNITLDVLSAESDHAINGNWYLSGSIQLVLDSSSAPTTGSILSNNAPLYASTKTTGVLDPPGNGTTATNVTVSASRKIEVVSKIRTGSGKTSVVSWTQDLKFENFQAFLDDANVQYVKQTASGTSVSTHNGVVAVEDKFSYPLEVLYYGIYTDTTEGWYTSVDHSYDRTELPSPLRTLSTISTTQSGHGTWLETLSTKSVVANGTTSETFSYYDLKGNTYTRDVTATNSSVVSDRIGGSLSGDGAWSWPWTGWGSSGLVGGAGGKYDKFVWRKMGKDGRGSSGA